MWLPGVGWLWIDPVNRGRAHGALTLTTECFTRRRASLSSGCTEVLQPCACGHFQQWSQVQRAQKCLKHALNRPQKGHLPMQRAGAASRLSQQAVCHRISQLGMYPLGDSNFCHSACAQEWLQKQPLCWSQVLMSVNEYTNLQTDRSNSKVHLCMCLHSCTVLCIIKKKVCFTLTPHKAAARVYTSAVQAQ